MSRARVFAREAKSILTPTGGYLHAFTHSLQPYKGCQFSCAYCYVREMAVQRCNPYGQPWAHWIEAKTNAPALLRRLGERGRLCEARIFCASATDPYVPLERRMGLTRGCLEVFAEHPPAALVLQTRSPFVAADAERIAAIPTAVVSMTVTTDDEGVRRWLEPDSPSLALRLEALRILRKVGVRTQVAVAPLLPCDPERLAALLDPVADRVVVDDFHRGDGAGGRRSRAVLAQLRESDHAAWAEPGYADGPTAVLRRVLGAERVLESQAGFNALGWVASGRRALS